MPLLFCIKKSPQLTFVTHFKAAVLTVVVVALPPPFEVVVTVVLPVTRSDGRLGTNSGLSTHFPSGVSFYHHKQSLRHSEMPAETKCSEAPNS